MTELMSKTRIEAALATHGAALRRFVRARANPADIDDILQISAMRALEKAHRLRDPEKVLAWLYTIHRNVITDFGRKLAADGRLKSALAAEVNDIAAPAPETCRCSLTQASQLNSRYASILSLVDMGGASLKDAAQELGLTVNAATVRLHRARHALKTRLMNHCGIKTMQECLDCICSYKGCC